jgi:MmyB-like transcription regulator ligand binding domain
MLDDPASGGTTPGSPSSALPLGSSIPTGSRPPTAPSRPCAPRPAATHDKPLTDIIGELVTRSDEFRYRWSAHNVRFHLAGTKRIHHPDVGDLEFTYEGLELPDSPGLVLYAYTAAAGSPTEERLQLLGSLAATRTAQSARDN